MTQQAMATWNEKLAARASARRRPPNVQPTAARPRAILMFSRTLE
jgi:hypothetical protein